MKSVQPEFSGANGAGLEAGATVDARAVNAAAFERVWSGGHWLKQRLQFNLEVARKDFLHVVRVLGLPRRQATILDVGFGSGMLLFTFAPSYRLLGTELSPTAIRKVRQAARKRGYQECLFVIPPANGTLPFRGGVCDVVIASHIVEHVADDIGLMREMLRVLKPGGRLVLLFPLDAQREEVLSEADLINPAHLAAGHYHVRNYNLATLLHRLQSLNGHVIFVESDAHAWDWKQTLDPWRQQLASTQPGHWLDRVIAAAINIPLSLLPRPLLRALDGLLVRRGYRARQAVLVLERGAATGGSA
jgi:SAM-dependent methyltransferase